MKKSVLCLAISLSICFALSACTVTRVSLVPPRQPGPPVSSSDVKFSPSVRDIGATWSVDGMISAYTLPIVNNSAEKREALIRKEVAGLGVDTVVGLQSLTGKGHASISNGILVDTRRADPRDRAKFIAFLPPVNVKVTDGRLPKDFDDYMREHIQYFLSYTKGYYVHRWDYPDSAGIRAMFDTIPPEQLLQPLGITPDFILLCDVEGYDEHGHAVTHKAASLSITLTLFDLREKKIFWTSAGSGTVSQSALIGSIMLTPLFGWSALLTESEETSFMVRRAIQDTIASLPAVPGFKPGVVSPVDRK